MRTQITLIILFFIILNGCDNKELTSTDTLLTGDKFIEPFDAAFSKNGHDMLGITTGAGSHQNLFHTASFKPDDEKTDYIISNLKQYIRSRTREMDEAMSSQDTKDNRKNYRRIIYNGKHRASTITIIKFDDETMITYQEVLKKN